MAHGVTAKRFGQASLHTLRWMLVMLRNGRLPAGLGALALAAILTFVVTDTKFRINRVVVTGVASLSGSTVAESTGVLGQSVFRVDATAVARNIVALPGVQHVEVSSVAPDTLLVRVQERQPVLIWEASDGSYLIDDSGAVLARLEQANVVSLPRLRAVAGIPSPAVGGRVSITSVHAVVALSERLPTDAGVTTAAIALDPTVGLIVQTERWRVVMGNDEHLGQKLAVLKSLVRDQSWIDLDLRDPDRPVLKKIQTQPTVVATPVRKP